MQRLDSQCERLTDLLIEYQGRAVGGVKNLKKEEGEPEAGGRGMKRWYQVFFSVPVRPSCGQETPRGGGKSLCRWKTDAESRAARAAAPPLGARVSSKPIGGVELRASVQARSIGASRRSSDQRRDRTGRSKTIRSLKRSGRAREKRKFFWRQTETDGESESFRVVNVCMFSCAREWLHTERCILSKRGENMARKHGVAGVVRRWTEDRWVNSAAAALVKNRSSERKKVNTCVV